MLANMRVLILMRHAKAVRDYEAPSDFDRGLTKRGWEEAARTSRLLADIGLHPDRALVSNAQRTRDTIAAFEDPPRDIEFDDALYLAGPRTLHTAASAAADADTLLMIGHNPGLKQLAAELASQGEGHNASALERLALGLPTSWACIFRVDGMPTAGRARFVHLVGPERADG